MAALNEKQSREICRKIEQYILKNGYFILDTSDWDNLHIEHKPFTHGKDYEYADYTEITVTLDSYNVTDNTHVKYNFIKSVYAGQTGDSYRVYYKRKDGEIDGGRQYSMDEAAEFIANRFIGLVEDKIMDKKFESHKEYQEAVYKDRVYRWFTNSTKDMSDSELQKFVNLCMRGNLTFQCADEIDIDDPDISMIDHLLMDIASEKNDELINTYTDEIDWDNDYLEKCYYKKLEARVKRLETAILESRNRTLESAVENKPDRETLIDDFNKFCKSCNLPEPEINGSKAVLSFDMEIFYRRIQKRSRYRWKLKYFKSKPVTLTLNLRDGSLTIEFLNIKQDALGETLNSFKLKFKDRILSRIGDCIDAALEKNGGDIIKYR